MIPDDDGRDACAPPMGWGMKVHDSNTVLSFLLTIKLGYGYPHGCIRFRPSSSICCAVVQSGYLRMFFLLFPSSVLSVYPLYNVASSCAHTSQ